MNARLVEFIGGPLDGERWVMDAHEGTPGYFMVPIVDMAQVRAICAKRSAVPLVRQGLYQGTVEEPGEMVWQGER